MENNWKPQVTIISHWKKWENSLFNGKGGYIHLRLMRTLKINKETGEAKHFFKICCTRNPLPVKGEFESSYNALGEFLFKEGFILDTSHGNDYVNYIYTEDRRENNF